MILDSIENKQKILHNFLEIVQFDGWNDFTLSKAIELSDIDKKFQNLIFENGCLDLIEFYIEEQNRKLLQKIAQNNNFSALKVRQKITFALVTIFENEQKHQLALQRLRNFYLDAKNFSQIKYGPKPLFLGLKHAAKMADFIWLAINDKSTDFNFYTKRLTLAKIILQSFFVFVKDDSGNLLKTKNFIDLQIEKVMKFEKFKSKIRGQVNGVSKKLKHVSHEFLCDEAGNIKPVNKIIKDLPFIRLFNFK